MLTNRKPGGASSRFTSRLFIRHELNHCVKQVGLSQSVRGRAQQEDVYSGDCSTRQNKSF